MMDIFIYGTEFIDWIIGRLYAIVNFFFYTGSRVYWLFLIISAVFAVFSYRRYISKGRFVIREFLAFLTPKHIYLHPSAILDYKLFIANRFVRPVTALTAFMSTAAVGVYVGDALSSSSLGVGWQGLPINPWTLFCFTLIYALISDFVTFLNHALHHKLSLLWPIHSVHHSAEVMIPLTVYRKHPLYGVVKFLIRAPLLGAAQGLTLFLFTGKVDPMTLLGINMFHAVFLLAGSCLRHTHIWFSFGPILNYILISPAHHQIHHSARLEHRDSNFGEVFAIWDWLFGTLILPNEEIRKTMIFGIALDAPQRHPTLVKAYVEPLQSIFQVCKQKSIQLYDLLRTT